MLKLYIEKFWVKTRPGSLWYRPSKVYQWWGHWSRKQYLESYGIQSLAGFNRAGPETGVKWQPLEVVKAGISKTCQLLVKKVGIKGMLSGFVMMLIMMCQLRKKVVDWSIFSKILKNVCGNEYLPVERGVRPKIFILRFHEMPPLTMIFGSERQFRILVSDQSSSQFHQNQKCKASLP